MVQEFCFYHFVLIKNYHFILKFLSFYFASDKNAKKLCLENNNFKDGLLIWGRISQEMQDMMKKIPAGHPHAVTPERLARWEAASTHPDENDFKKAEEFFINLLNK